MKKEMGEAFGMVGSGMEKCGFGCVDSCWNWTRIGAVQK